MDNLPKLPEQLVHILFGDILGQVCDVQIGVFHVSAWGPWVGHFQPLVPTNCTGCIVCYVTSRVRVLPESHPIYQLYCFGSILRIIVFNKSETVAVAGFEVTHYLNVLHPSDGGEYLGQVLLHCILRYVVDNQFGLVECWTAIAWAVVCVRFTIVVRHFIVLVLPLWISKLQARASCSSVQLLWPNFGGLLTLNCPNCVLNIICKRQR